MSVIFAVLSTNLLLLVIELQILYLQLELMDGISQKAKL